MSFKKTAAAAASSVFHILAVAAVVMAILHIFVLSVDDTRASQWAANPSSMRATVVSLKHERGSGSGVVVAPGVILTAKHVVDGIEKIQVDQLGNKYTATLIVEAEGNDIALIVAPGVACPCAHLSTFEGRVDDEVVAIGWPLSLGVQILTYGHVQGVWSGGAAGEPRLVATTNIAPGNSGGGLFRFSEANGRWELAGITVAVPTIPLTEWSFTIATYVTLSILIGDVKAIVAEYCKTDMCSQELLDELR